MISSSKKNESHDLRLLHFIYDDIVSNNMKSATYTQLNKIVKKVKYGIGLKGNDKQFGTKEYTKMDPKGYTIRNVTDAFFSLKKAIEIPDVIRENAQRYSNPLDCIGSLHIYDDGRPMVFERTDV